MKEPQILSVATLRRPALSAPLPSAPSAAVHAATPVFDACQVGVILRAVVYVQAVLGVGLLYVSHGVLDWLADVALLTAGALPATLLWLVLACSMKGAIARWPLPAQVCVGLALGALAGAFACSMVWLLALVAAPRWLAGVCTGVLLAAGLVAGLVWRVRGRTPAATAARLAELQSRIRPHFLFNTLNSAIALVRDEPHKAEKILEDLSDLFRHALTEVGDSATLAQEIALARQYLEIEQVRFGPRLRVQWSVDARAGAALLPPLILQPLVENAIKHGVEPSPGGAQLRVSVRVRGNMAVIKIANTVPAGQGRRGHGIALANVRDRLRLLHDLHGAFRASLAGGVYQVRIEVPLPDNGQP